MELLGWAKKILKRRVPLTAIEIVLTRDLNGEELRSLAEIIRETFGDQEKNKLIASGVKKRISKSELSEYIVGQLEARRRIFPEGQFALRYNKKITAGLETSLEVDTEINGEPDWSKIPITYNDLRGDGYFYKDGEQTHNKDGKVLVCSSIYVHPKCWGKGITRYLLNAASQLAKDQNKRMGAYTRPNSSFRKHLETTIFKHKLKDKDILKIKDKNMKHYLRQYLPLTVLEEPRIIRVDSIYGGHMAAAEDQAEEKGVYPKACLEDPKACFVCYFLAYPKDFVVSKTRPKIKAA